MPALVVYLGVRPALETGDVLPVDVLLLVGTAVGRVSAAYIAFTVVRSFRAFLDAVNDIYTEGYAEAKSRPIKGYLQVIGTGCVSSPPRVVIISILAGPLARSFFLSGIGALAAVLMLVFRDTILSLVASVQIASNDMIRIGDWVSGSPIRIATATSSTLRSTR